MSAKEADHNPNDWSREAWNANAAYWDQRMGEGNDFFTMLVWPAVERLLAVSEGMRVLDVACGNGLTSRRMAEAGARVTAVDFAQDLLALAETRGNPGGRIEYRLADATNEQDLLALGRGEYDAALCNMALFDMAEIRPLFRALAQLLAPGGAFVFSILHPCFNSSRIVKVAEEEDIGGVENRYAVKIYQYMTSYHFAGVAMRDQPKPQPYFHRPLQEMLAAGFEAGFVLDGLEERAFPPGGEPQLFPLSWGTNFSEIPPVMVARMRTVKQPG